MITSPTAENLRAWLTSHLATLRGVDARTIDVRERFSRYGLDSLGAGRLIAELADHLGRPLSPTLVWEVPTIEALAAHLTGAPEATTAPRAISRTSGAPEPIAIVGMSCRFPKALDLASFWRLLEGGIDAITEVPGDRWDAAALFDPDPAAPGKVTTRWGGFLDQVDGFDPQFFGISPREAVQMDPQQRLALELAWEALEDAGIPPLGLVESRTGVFIGALFTDYARLQDRAGAEAITTHSSTGGAACIIANRISYALGLQGPSLTVDTACSSSLVAVHLACQSLRAGESDLALAGGVNLMLIPETTMGFSRLGAMSPDGRSRAFDARANGYVRSEGAGVLALKRLSDALRDGDPIHAVVRGSAVNNDGASNGLTAPNPRAQQAVLREACERASLAPGEVHYVEAHGTGTPLGDPIEAAGLGAVFGSGRATGEPLLIGSAKSNVGHLEAAAGVVGLIKVALAMKHDVLPPSLHFETPNPRIDFETLRLQVVTRAQPWPAPEGALRRAGVSSFGYGGTNAHVILESMPRSLAERAAPASAAEPATPRRAVWVFSGQGSQWAGMGRALVLAEPAFRAALARCDAALLPHLGWSVFAEVLAGAPRAVPERIDIVWPTLFAFQVALAGLLRSLGAAPTAVIGHSIGEVTAAHVAGALSLDDAARVIACQARLVQRAVGLGSMLVAAVGWDEAQALAAASGGRVTCAIAASPVMTVLAGDPAALADLRAALTARGVFCRPVNTGAAVHGPQMAFLADELPGLLAGISPARTGGLLISTLTGEPVRGDELDAAYWTRQLREPVLFLQGTERLLAQGYDCFLEVSPHPIVKQSIEETARHRGASAGVAATLFRGEDEATSLREALALQGAPEPGVGPDQIHILPVSGQTESARRDSARRLADFVEGAPGLSLHDLCYTAGARRPHHRTRAAIVARGRAELLDGLRALAEEREHASVSTGAAPLGDAPKLSFVFPGQGSQWLGMGKQLLAEDPAFRAKLEACDDAIRREGGFSILEEIQADETRSQLARIDVVQPLLFAIEVALAAAWRSWGVEPDCVIGHSMGEVAAAHVAGILTLEDATKVICRRSRLLRRISGKGAMGLVELALPDAEKAITGHEDRLSVAVSNGPRTTVISGDPAALEEVLATLEKQGVFCRRVKVDVASHSPQVDPLREELLAALADIRPRAGRLAMWSTVLGRLVNGAELDAGYWMKNLRAPVLFSDGNQRLIEQGHVLFVELSPHPILLPAVEENLREKQQKGAAIASLRRNADERRSMLDALGALHVWGVDVAWKQIFPNGGPCVALPTYPWQRERCWLDLAPPAARRAQSAQAIMGGHPLLGAPFRPADRPGAHYWEQWLSVNALPYLAEHEVRGAVVFPGAAYVEMVLAAVEEVYGDGAVLENISFEWILLLAGGAKRRTQLLLVGDQGEPAIIEVSSRNDEGNEWVRHVRATAHEVAQERPLPCEPLRRIQDRCTTQIDGAAHYARMTAREIQYGPAFQGVERIWIGTGEALGRVRLPEQAGDSAAYRVHPALLDACFQVSYALFGAGEADVTFVPVGIDRLRLHKRPPRDVWVKATLAGPGPEADGMPAVNLAVVDDEGQPLLDVTRLVVHRLARVGGPDPFASCAYTVAWRRKDLAWHGPLSSPSSAPSSAPSSTRRRAWVVFVDSAGLGNAVAAQLRERGEACIEVVRGHRFARGGPSRYVIDPAKSEDYQRLFRDILTDVVLLGVVHMWSLDAARWEDTTVETLLLDLRQGTLSALLLMQNLVSQGFRDAPRLVLVTRGAQAAAGEALPTAVSQAPLWGLGRTIAMEQPDLACTQVDLAPVPQSDEAEMLVWELLFGDGEDQIALREDGRRVARLERADIEPAPAPVFDAQGSYLITGGLGGLGLAAARWMVSHGARHLVLVGRGDPSDAAREAMRAMQEAGADVRAWRADVSAAADVEDLIAQIKHGTAPLRGVIHAAGVLDDRTLLEMGEAQFWRPVNPKVLGAWNLHAATRDLALDFFVMYSSATALLGSPGQGNYIAANCFLDALAHARTAEGMPAMSIQWGTFSDVGLAAAQENRGQRLSHRGIDSFTPMEGTELLSRLLARPQVEVGLLRMSIRQWVEFYPRAAAAPFLAELREKEGRAATTQSAGRFREELEALLPAERRAALERNVLECLGRVLRLPVERIDVHAPFRGYGLDSLMSLEVRNRLEASLGLRLSASLLFTYSTIATLADHLLGEMPFVVHSAPQLAADVRRVAEPNIQFFELSEESARAMLDEKLLDLEDYLK